MKPRFAVLLVLLTAVIAATVWRAITPRPPAEMRFAASDLRQAPEFQLLDQHDRPVQLSGFLNRYRILLAFFDAQAGPKADRVLTRLAENHAAMKRSGIIVLGISAPLTPEHKLDAQSFPFPILRDTLAGQPGSCTQLWGTATFDPQTPTARVRPALFLIESNGLVEWDEEFPRPVENPEALISDLLTSP